MQTFDAIVIGCGGVGSAAAMQLAKRGARVLALDRFPPGHDRGSSHGQTRVIRLAYFEHPDYVPLLRRAYELWAELEATSGETLYHEVGLIQVGPPAGEVIAGVRASAKLHNLEIENVIHVEFAQRFPAFRLNEDQAAVFERRAGYLLVERCVIAHAEEAIRNGAIIRTGETVRSWRSDGASLLVECDTETFAAKHVIVTAGAWASELLSDIGVSVRALRKPLFWFAPTNHSYRADTGSPCFLYDLPEGCFYGFPQIDNQGVKLAEHTGGEAISDPLQVTRDLNQADLDRAAQFVDHWMPALTTRLTQHATCLYEMSADGHFIIDRHPSHPHIVFAAGLSGHGFKFTSVLGEILADLCLGGRTSLPIDFLSLARPGLTNKNSTG